MQPDSGKRLREQSRDGLAGGSGYSVILIRAIDLGWWLLEVGDKLPVLSPVGKVMWASAGSVECLPVSLRGLASLSRETAHI